MKQNKTIFLLLFPLCLSFSSCSNKVSTKDPIIDEYKDISFTFCANCDDLTAVVYQELIEEYKKTVERDERKFNKCKEHGITILYFSYEKEIPDTYLNKVFTKETELINNIKKYHEHKEKNQKDN